MKAKVRRAVAIAVVFLLVQVVALLVVALWPSSGGGGSSGPTPVTTRAVTLEEAESLLGFEVKLPSFLPEATSPAPALYVGFVEPGQVDWLEAAFAERDTATATGLRIRIMQSPGDMPVSGSEEVKIGDTSVQLDANLSRSELWASWTQAGMRFDAEFVWLRDGQPESRITEEMRNDALRTIRSMIEGSPQR